MECLLNPEKILQNNKQDNRQSHKNLQKFYEILNGSWKDRRVL